MGVPVDMWTVGSTSIVKEVELWNGGKYNEIVCRDRWIDARIYSTVTPLITPDGLFKTYHLELRQRGGPTVNIGIMQLFKKDVADELSWYRIKATFKLHTIKFTLDNFNDENLAKEYTLLHPSTWEGWDNELPPRMPTIGRTLIEQYDRSPRKIAEIDFPKFVRQLNTQKCRALSMAFHPRLGAAAAIRMLDDALIDKIFEYCDDMHPYELRP